jgi:hypothetical protein
MTEQRQNRLTGEVKATPLNHNTKDKNKER